MPITKSAKKTTRSSIRKRVFNMRRKEEMKKSIKSTRNLMALGNSDEARKNLPVVYKAIDKAAKRGIIKKNTAARYKSRITTMVNKKASA